MGNSPSASSLKGPAAVRVKFDCEFYACTSTTIAGVVWRFLLDFWFKLLIEFHGVGAKAETVKNEKGFVCSLLIINFQWDFEYITWHLRRRRLFDLLFSLTHSTLFHTFFFSLLLSHFHREHIFVKNTFDSSEKRGKCLFATSI